MKIASTIIQLTIGPSKNFLSHIGTPCVTVQAIRNITNFCEKNSYEFWRIRTNFVLKFMHEIRGKSRPRIRARIHA